MPSEGLITLRFKSYLCLDQGGNACLRKSQCFCPFIALDALKHLQNMGKIPVDSKKVC